MAGHWGECEHPDCRKFYWSEDSRSRFCDRACARSFDHLCRRPERPELLAMIDQFLSQPEIDHNPRIRRAVYRVFK